MYLNTVGKPAKNASASTIRPLSETNFGKLASTFLKNLKYDVRIGYLVRRKRVINLALIPRNWNAVRTI